jgi:ribosome biogenesis GTPase
VAVEAADGQVFHCHLHRNQAPPVVGDEVLWQLANEHTGTILQIKPRKTVLMRGTARGSGAKAIAANLDIMAVVMSPPLFSAYLVDRYLAAAELLHIGPLLVLNKADLLNETNRASSLAQLAPYRNVPYPVVLSSIHLEDGLQDLRAALRGKSAVLVGPSGVGKSSIIAALGSAETIRVNAVSLKGAGKHTTTATRLYHLPQGTCLIDSPGVREFTLWPIGPKEVLQGFKEFSAYVKGCKFRDCMHMLEPDCAVQAAVLHGKIDKTRYASYQKLMKEAGLRQSRY